MDLEVTEIGRGDDLVVFVHGVFDRGRSFAQVADRLKDVCRMRWYDRRGYGASADPKATPIGVVEHAADIVTVLEGEPAVLVGHSFGGLPVLGAAVIAPDLVRAGVLYEAGVAWAPGWPDSVMSELLAGENAEAAGLAMMLGERYDALDETRQARFQLEARAFVAEEKSTRLAEPPFDLREICAPLVYGASDLSVFGPIAEFLGDSVDRVEVVEMAGADHFAHRSDPDRFAELVRLGLALSAPERHSAGSRSVDQ